MRSRRSTRQTRRRRATRPRARAARPAEPPAPPLAPDPRLIEGVTLYNHQRFFECHDVLEALWLQTDGPAKPFYKGLIQAAVAFYHWSRGNLPGALTLARSSAAHLNAYRPVYAGIEVAGFLEPFTGLFQWLRRHRERYDARLVPPIRWASASVPGSGR